MVRFLGVCKSAAVGMWREGERASGSGVRCRGGKCSSLISTATEYDDSHP